MMSIHRLWMEDPEFCSHNGAFHNFYNPHWWVFASWKGHAIWYVKPSAPMVRDAEWCGKVCLWELIACRSTAGNPSQFQKPGWVPHSAWMFSNAPMIHDSQCAMDLNHKNHSKKIKQPSGFGHCCARRNPGFSRSRKSLLHPEKSWPAGRSDPMVSSE